jgi:serine/threonine protein kinase
VLVSFVIYDKLGPSTQWTCVGASSRYPGECVDYEGSTFVVTLSHQTHRRLAEGHREPVVTLAAATRLGPYEILGTRGAGGMGEVYRARDTKLDRDVAIKILPEMLAADPDRLARFEREAQAIAALSHPNILAIWTKLA